MQLKNQAVEELRYLHIKNFIGAWSGVYAVEIKDHEILKIMRDVAYNKELLAQSTVSIDYVTQVNPCNMCGSCEVCEIGNYGLKIMKLNVYYIADSNPDYITTDDFDIKHKEINNYPVRTLSINFCDNYHWFITDYEVGNVRDHFVKNLPF